jgi:chemotaxis protein CheY-P-specific phosphatase CheC
MGGLLKGKTNFLGRSRASVDEMQAIGERAARAALATMEKLTRTPVEMTRFEVFLGPRSRVGALLAHHSGAEIASRFRVTGTAAGMLGLAMKKADAARLAALLLGRDSADVKRFDALEESTIAETVNIVLNGALNALAREEGVRFSPEVPEVEYRVKDAGAFFAPGGGNDHLVVVETTFREPRRDVTGALLVVFSLE